MIFKHLIIFLFFYESFGLENGLARTPPMGWMSWTVFLCQIDCKKHPNTCISEQLYMHMADRMANDGFLDAGYNILHIDDCWMSKTRTSDGKLTADPERFPSGMPALIEYAHQRRLKFGIYATFGHRTCMGFAGTFLNHIEIDAQTFADWKADYLKFDGCFTDLSLLPIGYPKMAQALNKTGRPIVYSCSWPAYLVHLPDKVNYAEIGRHCNLWRNFMPDVEANWKIIMQIVDYYTENQDKLIPANGPGHWHDPDMIVVGDPRLTPDQSKAQMALWAIWSAPLIMSNDLRTIESVYKEILLNKRVIAVDQDPLGIMGRMVKKSESTSVYVKKMMPCDEEICSYAIAILNRGEYIATSNFVLNEIGLTYSLGYKIIELWEGTDMGVYRPDDAYRTKVPPMGVHLVKATPTIIKTSGNDEMQNLKEKLERIYELERSIEKSKEPYSVHFYFLVFAMLLALCFLFRVICRRRLLSRIRRKINLF